MYDRENSPRIEAPEESVKELEGSEPFSARYLALPALSPYIRGDRYEKPKQDYVHKVKKMGQHLDLANGEGSIIDLGCANGDFLYYLKKTVGPQWRLHGIDMTPDFIEDGRQWPGLEGVTLEVGDLLDLNRKYDVLVCSGTIQIFPDIENVLQTLLDSTNDGGWLFLDGQFNTFDVDTVFTYHDYSTKEGEGKWRCDFNIHSQKRITTFLRDKVKDFDFMHLDMDIDLPQDPDAPHINIHTLTLEDGSRIKTHGGRLIIDTYLLTIQK